ncbi:MAG: hypothetical protein C4B59_06840 [Candidatus Methanogaster sp.]|uniref:Uncharacterized protein n=1 Tax=Candidatus Methanogaster sp. TaxID=3386292 RepID=A0AC61L342_9EURY|nr:MAG: hypothetical protein C4B59_06840 [ANME-2 cluster archaeon]
MSGRIGTEDATAIVKNYFNVVKGELKVGRIPLIDALDFNIISVETVDGLCVVKCEFRENVFSDKNLKYTIKLSMEKGEITEVKRDDE